MNSAWVVRMAEWAALAAVWILAALLAWGPRRFLAARTKNSRRAWGRWLAAIGAALAMPLLALGLGWAVLWLPQAAGAAWAGRIPPAHRAAWALFWSMMAGLNLLEALVLQGLSAAGRQPVPALLRGVLRGVVMALAALFVLRLQLGWNITPLLASTALVTAVVGFALQGVLGNLLAGMSLNLTGTLSRRDWVMIGDLEGQVDEMNWRETWLVTLENVPVRVPNSRVADAEIRNLTRPAGPRRCSLFVDASYGDPPDAVIEALLAAAAAVPQVRRMPAPTAFVKDYKSYGVGYELWLWLDRYHQREPIKGEVRRHVWYQFRRAGIQIPYPVSDQVLNDFMERAIVPAEPQAGDAAARGRAAALLRSDFARRVLRDAEDRLLVPEEDLAAWAAGLEHQRFGRGETVFRQGEEGDCCHVVLTGRLEGCIRHGEEERETTFEVGPGAVVGEMSLMTGLPRTAEVRVKESAELLRIPAESFPALLAGRPGLVEQLSELVAERVRQNRAQLEELEAGGNGAEEPAASREGILRRFWRLLGGGSAADR